jgi:hypothetical protein
MRRWDSLAVGSHHLRRLKFELEFRNDTQLPIVLEAAAKERRSQKLIPILRSGPLRRNQARVRRPHCPMPNCQFADFINTIPSTAGIGGMMPHVRLGALKPKHHCHHCGRKCPTFTMICTYIRPRLLGRATPMTAQLHETTEAEFEVQVRNLVRLVSVCTLGLWSFSAGLLIGSFLLF